MIRRPAGGLSLQARGVQQLSPPPAVTVAEASDPDACCDIASALLRMYLSLL